MFSCSCGVTVGCLCVYPHLSCSNRLRAITINAIIFLSAFLVMALKQAIRTRKKNPETNEPPANHKTRNNEAVFDGWRGTGSLVYGRQADTHTPSPLIAHRQPRETRHGWRKVSNEAVEGYILMGLNLHYKKTNHIIFGALSFTLPKIIWLVVM